MPQQQAYLQFLAKGASPAGACTQLGISLASVAVTIDADDGFRMLLSRVNELLSQNVAAALYRSAMEGSVSAQTFYLKNRPPPEWPEAVPHHDADPLDDLTDDELIIQFRQGANALLALLSETDLPAAGDSGP